MMMLLEEEKERERREKEGEVGKEEAPQAAPGIHLDPPLTGKVTGATQPYILVTKEPSL